MSCFILKDVSKTKNRLKLSTQRIAHVCQFHINNFKGWASTRFHQRLIYSQLKVKINIEGQGFEN